MSSLDFAQGSHKQELSFWSETPIALSFLMDLFRTHARKHSAPGQTQQVFLTPPGKYSPEKRSVPARKIIATKNDEPMEILGFQQAPYVKQEKQISIELPIEHPWINSDGLGMIPERMITCRFPLHSKQNQTMNIRKMMVEK